MRNESAMLKELQRKLIQAVRAAEHKEINITEAANRIVILREQIELLSLQDRKSPFGPATSSRVNLD
jgi:hypothetical protein